MNKKIGLLTYFWAHNPGTFLQAYCMEKWLRKKFPNHKVELIDCRLRNIKFQIGRGHWDIFRLIEDYKHHKSYTRNQNLHLPLSPDGIVSYDYKILTEYINAQNYDLVVVGADTILELLPQHYSLGQIPVYWLSPDIRCKKVTFSSSAGALTYGRLIDSDKKMLSDSINSFNLLGVRDDNTYMLINDLGLINKSHLEKTPDPTFPFEIDGSFADKYIKEHRIKFKKPVIAINLPQSLSLYRQLVEIYESRGFRVVFLGYSRKRANKLPKMSVFEWAGIYRYFSLVITDRFHGTIFSLKNGTPVVSICWNKSKRTESGWSKMNDLLGYFHLEESNYIDATGPVNISDVVRKIDKAMENFDKSLIEERIKHLNSRFSLFMDKVNLLMNS